MMPRSPFAIRRLLDLELHAHLLKATLNGVMAQRLLRTLCTSCRLEVSPDAGACQELVQLMAVSIPEVIYRPRGCIECRNTGYSGRQAVYEIMPISKPLLVEINGHSDIQSICGVAVKLGINILRLAGAEKIAAGITSIAEVMRVTPESGC